MLGVDSAESFLEEARQVQGLPKHETFASLYTTSGGSIFLLSTSGKIYAWGSNDEKNLGVEGESVMVTPKKVEGSLQDQVVIKVMAQYHRTFALTKNGKLYAWGNNVE